MATAVACQKRHFPSLQGSHYEGVRRRAKGRVENNFFVRLEARHMIQTAAADDSNFRFATQNSSLLLTYF
jgi:hypothetical protein